VETSQATPLLTIAIPTYNRAERLARLLDSILVESKSLPWPLEVVVSDNASTDDTPQVVSAYLSRGSIKYRRNPTNLGFDRNLAAVVGCADGEFVWLMGDDDRVAPGFLPKLGSILQTDAVDFLIVCDAREDRPLERNLAGFFGIRESVRGTLKEFLFQHGLFGILLGMGHSVFRRRAAEGFDRVAALGTCCAHVFVLARCFAERRTLFLVDTAFITPVMTRAETVSYARRLGADGLWSDGWFNGLRPLMELVDSGVFPSPVPQDVFRMNYHQNWPIHYHVYRSLAGKIGINHPIPDEDWALLKRFDALLGEEPYTALLNRISECYRLRGLRGEFARASLSFVSSEPAAGPYPAALDRRLRVRELLAAVYRKCRAKSRKVD